jgi:hypothetical protein
MSWDGFVELSYRQNNLRVMDSVEESCQVQDPAIRGISVACIVAMLSSLEELCTGKGITEKYAEKINSTYIQMSTCDFEGVF